MVGMGVTIVLILAVGGVGDWYWLRIKETASHEKVEDKTPPRIPQEPIFGVRKNAGSFDNSSMKAKNL